MDITLKGKTTCLSTGPNENKFSLIGFCKITVHHVEFATAKCRMCNDASGAVCDIYYS